MHRYSRFGWMQAVFGTAALALALSVAVDGIAFGQNQQQGLAIGEYSPQQAFQQGGYQQIMQQKMRELQQGQQGEQGANRQQQAQQAQQIQQQVIEKFRKDVEAVASEVADQAQVNALIQGEVLYTGDGAASKDVTEALVQALKARNGGGGDQGEQPSPQQRLQRQ